MALANGPGPDTVETAQAEGEGLDPADHTKNPTTTTRPDAAAKSSSSTIKPTPPPASAGANASPGTTSPRVRPVQPKLMMSPPTPTTALPGPNSAAPPASAVNGGASPARPPNVRGPGSSGSNMGLPSPDSGAFPKEPGLTRAELARLAQIPATPNGTRQAPYSRPRAASRASAESTSPPSTISDHDADWSQPPTPLLPPSMPPSLPPSLPPSAPASRKNSSSGGVRPSLFRRPSAASASGKEDAGGSKRAPSVKSEDGHKFTLKDLLASGPKLGRRSSQKSVSSKRSDSDSKSAAGDSTQSLLKKYGVCEKIAIGKGATSVVRLAHKWDRTEEKLYAVKEFRKRRKNETEKEYVKKLTAEFCISSTLHHVNVVETVDLVQDEAQHWCEVMEFCPGGDLYAAIKKGGMSPSEVECCFKQMLAGVAYLHGQGVAHRDIKPENLLFDLKGHLKIGDFGASTVYRLPWEKQVHMSTGLCGSEPYIAPEQFLGKPYDARLVDVWACGIVYYCLHFQEIPWRAAQQTDQLYAAYASACASTNAEKSNCPPTINNLSPRACRPLIRKMLEPEPKKRSTIEDIVAHSWVESLDVCYSSASPKHIHVNATALAQAQSART